VKGIYRIQVVTFVDHKVEYMESDLSLGGMRNSYRMGELLESNVHEQPFYQFNRWMREAVEDNLFEPNAMSLATVSEDGQPSCRTVLLKGVLEEGLIFYSNYTSKKGRHIMSNSRAALLFWWREHERQVRIEGTIKKLPKEFAEDYFKSRPLGSRIAAISSPQSEELKDREALYSLFQATEEKYKSKEPDCPDYWGGYILNPTLFEFWQGRPNRLHDRLQYTSAKNGWKLVRLAP